MAYCAAKIAAAVGAGILGHDMYRMGQEGMRETDKEILQIMTCVD